MLSQVKYIQTNVTKTGDLLAMFEFAKEAFGAEANVLVNNAGIGDVYIRSSPPLATSPGGRRSLMWICGSQCRHQGNGNRSR